MHVDTRSEPQACLQGQFHARTAGQKWCNTYTPCPVWLQVKPVAQLLPCPGDVNTTSGNSTTSGSTSGGSPSGGSASGGSTSSSSSSSGGGGGSSTGAIVGGVLGGVVVAAGKTSRWHGWQLVGRWSWPWPSVHLHLYSQFSLTQSEVRPSDWQLGSLVLEYLMQCQLIHPQCAPLAAAAVLAGTVWAMRRQRQRTQRAGSTALEKDGSGLLDGKLVLSVHSVNKTGSAALVRGSWCES